jgi:hypothetical protein
VRLLTAPMLTSASPGRAAAMVPAMEVRRSMMSAGDVDQQPYSRPKTEITKNESATPALREPPGHRQQIGKSAALTVGALTLARAAAAAARH